MKKFLLLYKGPATPPNPSHEGWPEWFASIGDALIDRGSPLKHGFDLHNDGTASDSAYNLNGYGIVQAKDRDDAMRLLKDHPYLSYGEDYVIEVFELPN